MHKLTKFILVLVLSVGYVIYSFAQQAGETIIKAAGPQYKRSPFYQSLWGYNYRREWATPVSFPILRLDTIFGGLKPEKEGGGHQSKSLHLKSKSGKEYVIRSVDKTLRVVIPKIFYNTFIEDIANDEISISHPYAALTIPVMAKAAGIYHTKPKYFFLPEQPALDTFNKKYANALYLFEQRPDGNWSEEDDLGNFREFISSEKVRENIYEDKKKKLDQAAFVKARLFDMFIGDWDRHEDQWKWAPVEKDNYTIYEPIPVDRDQPYAKFDGLLLKSILTSFAKYMQSFDYDIPYPEGFSYERRNLDRFFTNSITLDQWLSIARELQQKLTDSVIETSIHQLPAEIFYISGNEIIAKLKSRRAHLPEYAAKYYLFIAKNVDITGTTDREYFKVSQLNDNESSVDIYDIKDGQPRTEPHYSRIFSKKETDEIRLYGLSGKDIYTIDAKKNKGIKIRVIGGDDRDSVTVLGKGAKVHIYDDKNENSFRGRRVRLHLSSDSTVHGFDYDAFRPEKKGLGPNAGYNDEDRLFVGLKYGWLHRSFRKDPFAFAQAFGINYSISQTAVSVLYTGIFPKLVGKWDLLLRANYDPVRWTNFYGLGNSTTYLSTPTNYFRLRTYQWLGSASLNRTIGKSNISFSGFYNSVRILQDKGKFISNNYLPSHPENLRTNAFVGGSVKYSLSYTDDPVVPLRGIIFSTVAGYTQNLSAPVRSFAKFGGDVQLYIPLAGKFSLAMATGAATVTNTPEFYQYPSLGGGSNLRGYTYNRFHGKTAFYNSNELRYITDINTYFFRGKAGLVTFFDNGRVWLPGESSNTLHTGYGGGILIAPFNIMFFDITYGVSKETSQIQFRGTFGL